MNDYYEIKRVGQLTYHLDKLGMSDECVMPEYEAWMPGFGRKVEMVTGMNQRYW